MTPAMEPCINRLVKYVVLLREVLIREVLIREVRSSDLGDTSGVDLKNCFDNGLMKKKWKALPALPVPAHPAHGAGPHVSPLGPSALPQQCRSRAGLQLPTAQPCLAMGPPKLGLDSACPRELPNAWGWGCPTAPRLLLDGVRWDGTVCQALPRRPGGARGFDILWQCCKGSCETEDVLRIGKKGPAWKNPVRDHLEEERRRPEELSDFQGSPPPDSRVVHPHMLEVKQRWQDACMDEQETLDKLKDRKRNIQEVETELQESQAPETHRNIWNKEELPLLEEDQVMEHLNSLDIHKSMGPNGMQPQVLRELADVTARPLR
ncbi:hypothetical protein QYF61_008688 [Mycteria americana]|uniref:Uncharacterized protein n=1 Tax=Mycteria americana TaxID=33587 RepID=A0AAN7PPG8_MYCAM|nr:hypothetical protein QYF61_008688 [Mycteria americana]